MSHVFDVPDVSDVSDVSDLPDRPCPSNFPLFRQDVMSRGVTKHASGSSKLRWRHMSCQCLGPWG